MVPQVLASYRWLMDGDTLRIGGRAWACHAGCDHALERMSLHCQELAALIRGAMVLPLCSLAPLGRGLG